MIIKKSTQLWDHVPTIDELKAAADPDKDLTATRFNDDVDISLYMRYTGLRIYYNGKSEKKGALNYKSDYKYIMYDNGSIVYPVYDIPHKSTFFLI